MKTNKQALEELVEVKSVYKKISSGYYDNKLAYSGKKDERHIRDAWGNEESRLNQLFKSDLEKEFDIADNPKADKLFEIAWSLGHSSGYSEVWHHYQELVDLVK